MLLTFDSRVFGTNEPPTRTVMQPSTWIMKPILKKIWGIKTKLGNHLDVSENSGTPKSSILIGFSIINHPFWGTPIFGNTHLDPPKQWMVGIEKKTKVSQICGRHLLFFQETIANH